VVDEVELVSELSLLWQPWNRINESKRTENEKRNEKVSFQTLL